MSEGSIFDERRTTIELTDDEPETAPQPEKIVSADKLNDWLRLTFRKGTPARALLGALLGMVLAVLLVRYGVWKTLLLIVLGVLGAFIGGVEHKVKWLRDTINRLFPARNEE